MRASTLRNGAVVAALVWTACSAPTGVATSPESAIGAEAMLDDVRALSADEMEGRAAGTPGEEKAAAYLEGRFREIGLAPLQGAYRQPVETVSFRKKPEVSTLSIVGPSGALELEDGGNVSFWSSSQRDVVDLADAPLLLVGYGVEAPEHAWDDYKGLDVSGKVLLFLNDDPPVSEDGVELFGGEARTYYGRWTYKFEEAMRRGAAGALVVHTTPSASYPFSVVQRNGTEEHFALDLPRSGYQVDLLGWLDEETSGRIAAGMGTTLDGLFEAAASRDFAPRDTGFRVGAHVETELRRITTSNVAGILEGGDPVLKEQVIVLSAHYDHLGTDPGAGGDPIFNGAWDNAAGSAAILAVAEAFAATEPRPRRSILFLACAAEEKGSLGSRWFVARPPIERRRLVANLNVDMPQIFGVTDDIAAIGVETNSLGNALRAVASAEGIRVTGDPQPNAGSFYRSDQVNFAKAGIPALFVNPGGEYRQVLPFDPSAYREAHYHQPSDEVREEWDLSGLERDMKVLYRTVALVADAEEMPRWAPGNEFEEAWRALHGETPGEP
jgi:Zn-dependent M28 family amino/carboxypeptidase